MINQAAVVVCLYFVVSGCESRARTAAPGDDSYHVPATQVADKAIIRDVGVPTAADDTAGTQYLTHEAPRRLPAPACLPSGLAFCITDTALTRLTFDDVEDGGGPDEHFSKWLVFAAAPDSMQLFVSSASQAYIRMEKQTAGGFSAEHAAGVDASWIRVRFPAAGAYRFDSAIESDVPVSYQLRVVPVVSTGASRTVGAKATLTITGPPSARMVIVPASMARSLDASEFKNFDVRAGTYRVLLVRDTSYVACRLPCSKRRTFTLHAGRSVTIAP